MNAGASNKMKAMAVGLQMFFLTSLTDYCIIYVQYNI